MNRFVFPALFAALALFVATPAALSAADTVVNRGGDPLVVPAASGLHFQSTDSDGTSKFTGRVLISGTYDYELGEDADSTSLEIVLDRETRIRLPHFKEHGTPGTISFSNAAGFALAAKLPKGTKTAHGRTAVWADGFEAGIECDVAFVSAHFVSLAEAPQKIVALGPESEGC